MKTLMSLALLPIIAASAAHAALDLPAITKSAGVEAKLTPDNVARIAWPRKEVPVRVDGVALQPFAGLTSWAAFTEAGNGAMMMGDTVVFEDEISPAMDAAFAADLDVTALHNHFVFDTPKVFFMHIGGHGDPAKLAAGVKQVWDAIKKVRQGSPEPAKAFPGAAPEAGAVSAAPLQQILGEKPAEEGGIVKFTIGREGRMGGVKVGGSMGLTTWAAFTGTDALAAVDGDFIMTANEVQPVLRALRKAGINVVALHNHMMGEEPVFYFTHFWGKAAPDVLARGLKSALEAQKSAPAKAMAH